MHSIDNQVPKSKFNIDVDSDLKKTQGASQVYELIKSKQERQMKDPYEVKMEEMWEKRKKADPKLS